MKNKDVIDFLKHATPTILDLTENNIKNIEKDKELMAILKTTAREYAKAYDDSVGRDTNLSPYNSIGWFLAAALRKDIQNYYNLRYAITMASFIKMDYGTIFKIPEDSELSEKWRKRNYKKYLIENFQINNKGEKI